MINLFTGVTQSQVIVVTLNEKLPCDTFCYTPVFKFQHTITGETRYFICNDISSFTRRYNYFEVELVDEGDEDVLNGKINLKNVGMWFYTIYNQPCDIIGIDPDSFVGELERGYMHLREN